MRDILAQKVFGILPVEETKGDKSFTVYADGSYKAEMPINYKISLAKRPILLLEKDVQTRANHYLDALKDIKDKSVIKNLGGISLLPDGVVIDRIEKAFPEDSKGEGWYWTVACVLKLRPSSEEDAIVVQGAGVQIDIASTGNIMRLHSTVLPIMQPKKAKRFNLLDALKIRTHLDLPPITTNDNTLLSRSVTPTTETTTTNLSEFYASPDFYGYNSSKGCYAAYKQTADGEVAAGEDGLFDNEEVIDSDTTTSSVEDNGGGDKKRGPNCKMHIKDDFPKKGKGDRATGTLSIHIHFIASNDIPAGALDAYSRRFLNAVTQTWQQYRIGDTPVNLDNVRITTENNPPPSINGAWVITVGNGTGDPLFDGNGTSYVVPKNVFSPEILKKRILFRELTGYFYYQNGDPSNYAAHEFGHMFGLADRYHEMRLSWDHNLDMNAVHLLNISFPDIKKNTELTIRHLLFGRETLPMILCDNVDPDYFPFSNLMSSPTSDEDVWGALTTMGVLTPAQMEIVFSNRSREDNYPTVIFISNLLYPIPSGFTGNEDTEYMKHRRTVIAKKPLAARVYNENGKPSVNRVLNMYFTDITHEAIWVIPKHVTKDIPVITWPTDPPFLGDDPLKALTEPILPSLKTYYCSDDAQSLLGSKIMPADINGQLDSIATYNARIIQKVNKSWKD